MISLLLFMALVGPAEQVDMMLGPCAQVVPTLDVAEVQLVLSADQASSVAAVDAIIRWDPSELELLEAVPGPGPWFVTGFLDDPDGINTDIDDGLALYTALSPPQSAIVLPPDLVVATFRFRVMRRGNVELLDTSGVHASSKVVGTSPGQIITGLLERPSAIHTEAGTWTDLGGGTPGSNGTPTLAGTGDLVECAPTTITLTQAPPSTLTAAWISFAPVPFAALGGTVHAHPYATQLFFNTSASGSFQATTGWPGGLPPGTDVWFQFLVHDPTVPGAITLSNGLRATTPL